MKHTSTLLGNLTHTDITIHDRINNVSKISKLLEHPNVVGNYDLTHFLAADRLIEIVRVKLMELPILYGDKTDIDLIEVNDFFYNDLTEDSMAGFILSLYGNMHKALPYLDNHLDDIIDLVKYYNNIVPIINEIPLLDNNKHKTCGCLGICEDCLFNEISTDYSGDFDDTHPLKIIDAEFILNWCKETDYMDNYDYLYPTYYLLDTLVPGRVKNTNIQSSIVNNHLLVNEQISTRTIDERLAYIRRLESLIDKCPHQDITLLMDSITIEKSRIQCMYLYSENINWVEVEGETRFNKWHSSIPQVYPNDENDEGVVSIVESYMDTQIDKSRCKDLIDLIYYYNKLRKPPLTEITPEVLSNTFEHEYFHQFKVLSNLLDQFRIDTIESILR